MSRKSSDIRRSALSFIGANGSLDIDHVLQSNPWKKVEMFEKSEAACIQNVLNDFDNMITQEKNLKAGDTIAKKSPRTSPRPTKKSLIKSPIEVSTPDLFDTPLNTNSNVEIAINKKKRASTKPRQTSKKVEETISQKLACDIDVKGETSNTSAKEDADSLKQITQKEILHDVANISEKNLQTSTPKKGVSKITKKTAKKEDSIAEDKKSKIKDFDENKSKKNVQRKERQKISKKMKDTEDKQNENSANMLNAETNVENNLECNNVSQDTSKNKDKKEAEDEKEQSCTLVSQMEKKRKVRKNVKAEINNIEKNTKSKKCNKSMPNQLKTKKLKKENSENKLQKNAQSDKSSRINNDEKIKRPCRKNCAIYSGKQCCSKAKKHIEKMKQHKKSKKAAKAIGDLNRRITVVKKKMKCIKNDLENSESSDSDSSYTDESSYSTYSSSSYSSDSSYSCTSTCSCSYCNSDDTEYTLSSYDSSSCSSESTQTESAK